MKQVLAGFVLVVLAVGVGCSRSNPDGPPFANDLKAAPGPGAPARGGIPDDSIKPVAPVMKPVAKTGIPDDSIKPVAPVVKPVAKTGVPDDSVKPVAPVVGRGGIPDDSIKPAQPLPTAAPR